MTSYLKSGWARLPFSPWVQSNGLIIREYAQCAGEVLVFVELIAEEDPKEKNMMNQR